MNLTELKGYVRERGSASLHELSVHFRSDESAIEAMMERWIEKGVVRKVDFSKEQCSGCSFCSTDDRFHYEWIGPKVISFKKL